MTPFRHHQQPIQRLLTLQSRSVRLVAVLLIATLGTILLASSRAATSTASLNAANGTVNTPATVLSDATAANGHAVKFIPAPPAAAVKAFDSANTISDPSWFTKAYAAGFRLYVLNTVSWGTCNPWPQAQSQIANALAAGLKVAAYTRDPTCWQNGILAAGPYQSQLQFFALDIETDPGVAVTRNMVDGVTAMGVRPIIYTGSGMWPSIMGSNNTSFSDLPLWDTNASTFAYSTWQADLLSPKPAVYGGWNTPSTMRIGIQQEFEYTLNGINVDLNSFDANFFK